jgi:hypothetical protein
MKVLIDDVQYIPAPPVVEGKGLDAALAVRFDSDAGDQITVRDYFRLLLETLWDEGEGFSGKRPFGNSGWESDLLNPLALAGFVKCADKSTYHAYGDDKPPITECNFTDEEHKAAEAYVFDLIAFALSAPSP